MGGAGPEYKSFAEMPVLAREVDGLGIGRWSRRADGEALVLRSVAFRAEERKREKALAVVAVSRECFTIELCGHRASVAS